MDEPTKSVNLVCRGDSKTRDPEDFLSKAGTSDDVGIGMLSEVDDFASITEEESRKVLMKIDLHLLPMMCTTYLLQFLDKACISYAALWGMETDAHLSGTQYSWLTTIFYLGYLCSEFPTNALFQKLNITRTCGIYITLWGIILLCMTAANNFAGLMTARLFLGILECGVSPCFVLLTAMYYKRSEQPFRNSIWFSMNGLANILGALIGYGIGFIHTSLPSWKFPFVIWGSITIVWGVVFTLFTAPNPTKASWLNDREKVVAVARLAENETGIDNKTFKWYQVREACLDLKVWLLVLLTIANCIPNGGVSAFGPLIVNGFGYAKLPSTLLGIPSGASQIVALWISGYIATRVKSSRHLLMMGGLLVAILGAGLIYGLPSSNKVGRLIGYYLIVGFSVTFTLSLGLVQANIAGRTKKTVVVSAIFVAYCVGNLIGPQLFFAREAPHYTSGFASMLVCFVVQLIIVAILYALAIMENRKRDRTGIEETPDLLVLGLQDKTDKENLHFRYTL